MNWTFQCQDKHLLSPYPWLWFWTWYFSMCQASPSREPVIFNLDDDGAMPKLTRPTSLEARSPCYTCGKDPLNREQMEQSIKTTWALKPESRCCWLWTWCSECLDRCNFLDQTLTNTQSLCSCFIFKIYLHIAFAALLCMLYILQCICISYIHGKLIGFARKVTYPEWRKPG